MLVADFAVRNLVKEDKTNQIRDVVRTHQQDGMQMLKKALTQPVADVVVDLEQARLVSQYPEEVGAPVAVPAQDAGGRFGRRR